MDMREAPLVGGAVGAGNGRAEGAEGADVFAGADVGGADGRIGVAEGAEVFTGVGVGGADGRVGDAEGADVFNLSEPGQTHVPTKYACSSINIFISKH
jgi:hypothetical protein